MYGWSLVIRCRDWVGISEFKEKAWLKCAILSIRLWLLFLGLWCRAALGFFWIGGVMQWLEFLPPQCIILPLCLLNLSLRYIWSFTLIHLARFIFPMSWEAVNNLMLIDLNFALQTHLGFGVKAPKIDPGPRGFLLWLRPNLKSDGVKAHV